MFDKIKQHFGQKWYKDYLAQLQSLPKWRLESPNLKDGMLVLLKEDNIQSLVWPLARIIKMRPVEDGKVKVVDVKTATG